MPTIETWRRARFARWLLTVAMLIATGCVVPVAPDFQDQPNLPPYMRGSTPTEGAQISAVDGTEGSQAIGPVASQIITVTVADENVDDVLFLKWIVDYPPADPSVTRVVSREVLIPTGNPERTATTFQARCDRGDVAPGFARHRVMLTVADRPFDESGAHPAEVLHDKVSGNGTAMRAMWTLHLLCN